MNRPVARLLMILPLLAGLGGLAACSANPATGKQSFTAFMSPEREKEVGRQEHPKILEAFGGAYDDIKVGAYIAALGGTLSRHAELPGLAYTFTVLNDEQVNAFALPGGYVYITRGLLAIADDEAEVAGVLSHEIGHVTARHTAQRYSAAMATSLGLQVLGVLGGAAGVPGAAGNLASLGAQMALQSYSREQELESDMLGVRYMTRAGYDPDAMAGFFHKLKAHHAISAAMAGKDDTSEQFNIMATHPLTSERIVAAEKLAGESPVNGRKRNHDAFLDAIDGMIFGDDPKQGIRKGRVFEHPELGIRFEVPDGFTLLNMPTQVVGVGPDAAAIVFDMADPREVAAAGGIKPYVEKTWLRGKAAAGLESIDVNGMAGATATVRIKNSQGRMMDVRALAAQDTREKIFRLLFISPVETTGALSLAYRKTTYSLRRLDAAEIAAIKPLRIRLRTVAPGDTPESLAADMPLGKFSIDWFELLNGVARDAALIPGDRVRMVSE